MSWLTGNRKWSVVMTALVLAFVLAMWGPLSSGEFTTIVVTALGSFAAANAYEHKVQAET